MIPIACPDETPGVRPAVEKMIGWDPERIILAHGRWYDRDGATEVRRAFSWLLVSPRVHHVHHSAQRSRTDSNYGDVVTLWDRLFGTWSDLPTAEVACQRCGLGDSHDAGAGNILIQLRAPLVRPPDAGARA